jgi:hypothetical protein
VVGRRAAARNRRERGRTARKTGQWPWQGTVRAGQNRGGRSPRWAGYAIAGRFLATSAPNTATQTQLGISDRRTQGCSLHWPIGQHVAPTSAFAASAP